MKENRTKGFTLVELLIAMLASMIIIASVGQFLVFATKQYQAVDTQTNMQRDEQDAMNTICDMIMQGNNIARYRSGDLTFFCVYYDLGQYDSDDKLKNYKTAEQRIFYLDDGNVYLIHSTKASEYEDALNHQTNKQLLAEGVTSFNITTFSGSNLGKEGLSGKNIGLASVYVNLTFSSTLLRGGKSLPETKYNAKELVTIRNEVVAIEGR